MIIRSNAWWTVAIGSALLSCGMDSVPEPDSGEEYRLLLDRFERSKGEVLRLTVALKKSQNIAGNTTLLQDSLAELTRSNENLVNESALNQQSLAEITDLVWIGPYTEGFWRNGKLSYLRSDTDFKERLPMDLLAFLNKPGGGDFDAFDKGFTTNFNGSSRWLTSYEVWEGQGLNELVKETAVPGYWKLVLSATIPDEAYYIEEDGIRSPVGAIGVEHYYPTLFDQYGCLLLPLVPSTLEARVFRSLVRRTGQDFGSSQYGDYQDWRSKKFFGMSPESRSRLGDLVGTTMPARHALYRFLCSDGLGEAAIRLNEEDIIQDKVLFLEEYSGLEVLTLVGKYQALLEIRYADLAEYVLETTPPLEGLIITLLLERELANLLDKISAICVERELVVRNSLYRLLNNKQASIVAERKDGGLSSLDEEGAPTISVSEWKRLVGYLVSASSVQGRTEDIYSKVGPPARQQLYGGSYFLYWDCSDGQVALEVYGTQFEIGDFIIGKSISIF